MDSKHHLIVTHEVTNAVTDQGQLLPIAAAAQKTLGVETLEAVTDKGYYDGKQVQPCETQGITVYTAKPHTSANHKQGLFTEEDFRYDAEQDLYRCPAAPSAGAAGRTLSRSTPLVRHRGSRPRDR